MASQTKLNAPGGVGEVAARGTTTASTRGAVAGWLCRGVQVAMLSLTARRHSVVATTRANADRATTIEGKNGKGVRPGGERLYKLASVLLTHQAALHRSFTVCSRPLAARVCSLRAGHSLFGFAQPAL